MEQNQQKNLFGEVDYSKFKNIDDVLNENKIYDIYQKNKTASSIVFQDSLPEIIEKLKDYGFKKISPIVLNGSNAIVLEANNHQIIRIVHSRAEKDRAKDDVILQPIATIDNINNYRVEVLPKVRTIKEIIENDELKKLYNFPDDVSSYVEKLIEEIICASAKHEKILFDPLLENIGIVKSSDGKNIPIIMDSEAALDIANLPPAVFIQFSRRLLENKDVFRYFYNESPEVYTINFNSLVQWDTDKLINAGRNYFDKIKKLEIPEIDYASAQAEQLKLLGLDKGIITDKEVPELCGNAGEMRKYQLYSGDCSFSNRLAQKELQRRTGQTVNQL